MTGDLVAKIDQAKKGAADTARILAAFYKALVDGGASEACAAKLSELYAQRILK